MDMKNNGNEACKARDGIGMWQQLGTRNVCERRIRIAVSVLSQNTMSQDKQATQQKVDA